MTDQAAEVYGEMLRESERFTANFYFNGDRINKKLNDASRNFGYHLNADFVSYMVNTPLYEKHKDFRAFIASDEGLAAIDFLTEAMLQARFLEDQKWIEKSILKQEELLTSYIKTRFKGWDEIPSIMPDEPYELDQVDSSEESYW